VPDNILAKPNADDLRWYLLKKKLHEERIKRAFALFRSENIEPILIKGWAAGLNYPPDAPRYFGDTDLAVSAADYRRALEICDSEESAGSVDLHRELRHLDCLKWDDLFANARLVKIDDTDIRILRPEDHLRVLCVHWLTDGGTYKYRLADIYYAVTNRSPNFDWKRCLETVPENRRKWVIFTIGIANRYLGLNIDDLPFQAKAREIPQWMIRCIESEWKSEVTLDPVFGHIRSPSSLLKQIRKRIPPNPIRATIELEGRLDSRTRIFYQMGCIAKMFTHPLGPRTAEILRRKKKRA